MCVVNVYVTACTRNPIIFISLSLHTYVMHIHVHVYCTYMYIVHCIYCTCTCMYTKCYSTFQLCSMTDPSEMWRAGIASRQGSVKVKWPPNKEDREDQRQQLTKPGSTDSASRKSHTTGQTPTQVSGASTAPYLSESKIPSPSATKYPSHGSTGGSGEAALRKGHTGPVGDPLSAGRQHSSDISKMTPTGIELRRSSSPHASTHSYGKSAGQRSQFDRQSLANSKSRTTSSSSGAHLTGSSEGSYHPPSSSSSSSCEGSYHPPSSSSSSSYTVSTGQRDRQSGHMPSNHSNSRYSKTTHKMGGSEPRPHEPRPHESSPQTYDKSGSAELSLGGGTRGRMREVEDDMVHISMLSSEVREEQVHVHSSCSAKPAQHERCAVKASRCNYFVGSY